ncbi:MAG: type IV pilus twitching motility protein PilT [Cyanobacteria bacterium]|nr:type IV pilus twitching motility protein PilT [Cyanobacteriota bacterium]
MSAESNAQQEFLQQSVPVSSALDESKAGLDLNTFLRMSIARGISDVHLRVGLPPMIRADGNIVPTKFPPLSDEDMDRFAKQIMTPANYARLQESLDFDFGFDFEGLARFRANFFRNLDHLGMVLRTISVKIPSMEELGLPQVLKRFTELHKGLVLVTGPTGSGKSTTLAAILNHINLNYPKHIVTVEDPIEYIYTSAKSVVTQRQMGSDVGSFPDGVKYALRQDPDVILIGEMRDRDTMMAAINASETGHLVFSTLHTNDAVQTINRIINAFEPHARDPIRRQLSTVLQGTVSQRLVRKAEGKGRLAVAEIMIVTPAIRDYIYKDEIDLIYDLLKEGDYEGMTSLNHSLYRAYRNNYITAEEALDTSDKPSEMQQLLRGAYHGVN